MAAFPVSNGAEILTDLHTASVQAIGDDAIRGGARPPRRGRCKHGLGIDTESSM